MPFRDAHEVVGKAVHLAESEETELPMLSLQQLQEICESIAADVFDFLTLEGSVNSRDHTGGTAPAQVRRAVAGAHAALAARQEDKA